MIDVLASFARFLPEVKAPDRPVSIREKVMWIAAAIVVFFVMYNVTAYGVNPSMVSADFLQIITASKIGSLLTVGIGPIVLASIFLQLFKGAGVIKLDMSKPDERKKFHEAQKVLAIMLAFIEAGIFVYTGRTSLIANADTAIMAIVTLQIAFGAIVLFYLDEVISKYGIGSGISLFIAAGVALAIVGGFSNLILGENGVTQVILGGGADAIPKALITLLPFLFTIIVFLVVVYAEGMKVEIPVAYTTARGIMPKLPLKFFYVSNIPVIFASALLLNIQLFAPPLLQSLQAQNIIISGANIADVIGYAGADNRVSDGLLYFISPVYAPRTTGHWEYILNAETPLSKIPEWVHAITYVLFLIACSVPFGIFWAETGGMDSKSVAEQLNSAGLQIPGYRRDPRLLEKVLDKYISPLIIISSASVGFLAGMADLTGALGTGTGILLTVSILYRLYEDFEKLKVFDIYPQFTSMLS